MAHNHSSVQPHLRHDAEIVVHPENIQNCLNALKHIHMDIQSLEQDMHTKLFLLEAEQHKKMAPFYKKRADIISGAHEPSAAEAVFKLKDDIPDPETTPADDRKGIPNFWSTVLLNHNHTVDLIEEHDHGVLEFLADIRTVYQEKPLGFSLEFEFKENPWFSNKVLTRSYEFEDGSAVAKEDLYMSTGLQPKSSKGTVIDWKEGKNLLKGERITFQRNKKTGERRQMKTPIEQDSFFTFFAPSVTDLQGLMKTPLTEADEEHAADHMQKIQDAEMEYELASAFRTRIIPRALLIFTEKVPTTGQSEISQKVNAEEKAAAENMAAILAAGEKHKKELQSHAIEALCARWNYRSVLQADPERDGYSAELAETDGHIAVLLDFICGTDGQDGPGVAHCDDDVWELEQLSLLDSAAVEQILQEEHDAFLDRNQRFQAAVLYEGPPLPGPGSGQETPEEAVEPGSGDVEDGGGAAGPGG